MKLNPFLRYAGTHQYYVNKKDDKLCLDCRLFFIEEGDGIATINGEKYNIGKDTLIYIPPEGVYNFKFTNNYVKIHVLNFDLVDDYSNHVDTLKLIKANIFDGNNPIKYQVASDFSKPIVIDYPTIINKMIKCINVFNQKDDYYIDVCSAEIKLILINVIKHLDKKSNNSIVKSVFELIKKEYSNTALSNEVISLNFNYHPYHLNKIFKQETGVSLHKYLTDYRLDIAKYLLSTTLKPITQVSEEVGFSNYSYFIKVFRERFNLSPLKYRKTCLDI